MDVCTHTLLYLDIHGWIISYGRSVIVSASPWYRTPCMSLSKQCVHPPLCRGIWEFQTGSFSRPEWFNIWLTSAGHLTLDHCHELWIMTKRIRSQIPAAKISFPLRDKRRKGLELWRTELWIELLLLRIERWSWGGSGICISSPLDTSLWRCSRHAPWGVGLREDPRNTGITILLGWPGNAVGSSSKSWRKFMGRGNQGIPIQTTVPTTLIALLH